MKRLIPAALILLMLISTEGSYVIFKILQERARSEIKQEIRKDLKISDLTLIKIPLSETASIQWIKKDKEFRRGDELYDVVKTDIEGGFISFYCINDKKEEKLISDFNRFSSKKRTQNLLNRLIQNNYLPQVLYMPLLQRDIVCLFNFFRDDYFLEKLDIKKPPPKKVSFS